MQDLHGEHMSAREPAVGGLALVYAFRMLGMFMVLPVLATYGQDLLPGLPLSGSGSPLAPKVAARIAPRRYPYDPSDRIACR